MFENISTKIKKLKFYCYKGSKTGAGVGDGEMWEARGEGAGTPSGCGESCRRHAEGQVEVWEVSPLVVGDRCSAAMT